MYKVKEGKDFTLVNGIKLGEATQDQLKAMYEKGDKRFIYTEADIQEKEVRTTAEIKEVPEEKKKTTRKKKTEKAEEKKPDAE